MNKLTILNKQGVLLVDSREVAEMVDKEHSNLMRDIRGYENILENSKLSSQNFFIGDSYKVDGSNKTYNCYLLTKKGCDLVANKMIGSKGVLFTAQYVTQFEKMENQIKGVQPKLSIELQSIIMLDQRTTDTIARLDEFENTMPLFNTDCKDLQTLVRKIATKVLGGYRTPAYKDNSLRTKVYKDIQGQLRRQFGVQRYESIKRIQIDAARKIVSNYILPMFLQDDITLLNNQLEIPFSYEN